MDSKKSVINYLAEEKLSKPPLLLLVLTPRLSSHSMDDIKSPLPLQENTARSPTFTDSVGGSTCILGVATKIIYKSLLYSLQIIIC